MKLDRLDKLVKQSDVVMALLRLYKATKYSDTVFSLIVSFKKISLNTPAQKAWSIKAKRIIGDIA